jgi:uncharacterized membrane protein HdeD (DUF308 family)
MLNPALLPGVAGALHRYWWLFLIRGVFALALGVFAVTFPGATLAVLVILIGAYLFVDGAVAVVKAFRVIRSDAHWWVLLLEGVLGIVVGLVIFAWPGLSLLSLAYLVGYWAIFSGVSAIVTSMRLRTHVPGEWFYAAFGVISVIFGLFVVVAPAAGLAYIVLMVSIYGFVAGVTLIVLAFRARRAPAAP